MTWQHVLRWEHLHRDECGQPSLLRFLGRPDDTSPRARWRSLMGGACSRAFLEQLALTCVHRQARCLSTGTTGMWTAAARRFATSSTSTSTRAELARQTRSQATHGPRWTTSAACVTARRWGCELHDAPTAAACTDACVAGVRVVPASGPALPVFRCCAAETRLTVVQPRALGTFVTRLCPSHASPAAAWCALLTSLSVRIRNTSLHTPCSRKQRC